jgi:hypothetical protein
MDWRRRPVGGAPRKTVFGRLTAVIGRRRFAGEERVVIEASRVMTARVPEALSPIAPI